MPAEGLFDKAEQMGSASTGYSIEEVLPIAGQFRVGNPLHVRPFPGRGNINHTYEVSAGGRDYLLQKVNSEVFTMPHRVMNAMIASIDCQKEALSAGKGDVLWEPVELVPTLSGQPFLDRQNGHGPTVWRMMVRIGNSICYKSLSEASSRKEQLSIAGETGRGLAIYSDLTSSIDPTGVEGSLPGYRDTSLYIGQFRSILAGNRTRESVSPLLPTDVIVKAACENHYQVKLEQSEFERRLHDPDLQPFIQFVVAHLDHAMSLWRALESGRIRRTLIHGDTKIDNFLFCSQTGRVKALVDLDTIMPFTWLADWGDLVRSMSNVAGEKEENLSKVVVDWEVYEAVAKGLLSTSSEITESEMEMMPSAVEAIALELGMRFLTDYLRGDTYFRLDDSDPRDLNKTRACVQLSLCRRLMEGSGTAKKITSGSDESSRKFFS